MSTILSYDDFTGDDGNKPSPEEFEAQLKSTLQWGEPLTLTITKPLPEESALLGGEYVIPFGFDIKVFRYEGEFRITTGAQWSATVNIKVTAAKFVSRQLTFHLDYQRAEHCQELSFSSAVSAELCAGVRKSGSKLCPYLRGKVKVFGTSAKFDETLGCV